MKKGLIGCSAISAVIMLIAAVCSQFSFDICSLFPISIIILCLYSALVYHICTKKRCGWLFLFFSFNFYVLLFELTASENAKPDFYRALRNISLYSIPFMLIFVFFFRQDYKMNSLWVFALTETVGYAVCAITQKRKLDRMDAEQAQALKKQQQEEELGYYRRNRH